MPAAPPSPASPVDPGNAMTYAQAGVDIAAQDSAIESFKPAVERSHVAAERIGAGRILEGVGAFGAAFLPNLAGYEEPVLISSTDGLGTKVLLHARFNTWEQAGRDLVGTVVNDVICSGARPLFMLDYIAWHGLAPEQLSAVVSGVAAGCAEIGCALAGGELAEMRDVYKRGDFDLAGTAIGIVERQRMLGAGRVTPGSAVIGLQSSGVHANGFSLVRKALEKLAEADWTSREHGQSLADRLLEPTRCYSNALQALLASPLAGAVQAAAHISGGGLEGNLPRVIPNGLCAVLDRRFVAEAAGSTGSLFDIIRDQAAKAGHPVPESEMFSAFNMGVGFALVVDSSCQAECIDLLCESGMPATLIGQIESRASEGRFAWAN